MLKMSIAIVTIRIVENNIAYVSRMVRFVDPNVVALTAEIKKLPTEIYFSKRKEMSIVIVKKANVRKNIANVSQMVSNAVKLAIVLTARTVDLIFISFFSFFFIRP